MTVRRKFLGGGVLFGVASALFFSGCGKESDGYDPAWSYPQRADPIVVEVPTAPPLSPPPPGKLDESIAALPRLGGKLLDPKKLPADSQKHLHEQLVETFGSPAAPKLPAELKLLGNLDCSPSNLANGSRVYRRLCTACHGLTGDGRGPTGPWIFPYPRDFRNGSFKLSCGTERPRVSELVQLIRQGVQGTAMQPFDLIPEADLNAVTAYTIHLGLRGEVEFRTLKKYLESEDDSEDVRAIAKNELTQVIGKWVQSQLVKPPSYVITTSPDSIRRGEALFSGAAGCASCHADYGRKDTFRYDIWGSITRVHDITRGEYRWGKDPGELASRIRFGIPAANMPANPLLTDEQVKDLASFLHAVPSPARLPDDVRSKVYPSK